MKTSNIAAVIGGITATVNSQQAQRIMDIINEGKVKYTLRQSNGRPHDANGTSLQGYIDIPFASIASKLGYPTYTDGDKTLAEWVIKGNDGTIATIYDYKNYGMKKEQISKWHIGGKSEKAVKLIAEIFPGYNARKA